MSQVPSTSTTPPWFRGSPHYLLVQANEFRCEEPPVVWKPDGKLFFSPYFLYAPLFLVPTFLLESPFLGFASSLNGAQAVGGNHDNSALSLHSGSFRNLRMPPAPSCYTFSGSVGIARRCVEHKVRHSFSFCKVWQSLAWAVCYIHCQKRYCDSFLCNDSGFFSPKVSVVMAFIIIRLWGVADLQASDFKSIKHVISLNRHTRTDTYKHVHTHTHTNSLQMWFILLTCGFSKIWICWQYLL